MGQDWLLPTAYMSFLGFPGGAGVKNPPADVGDTRGFNPWVQFPEEGYGKALKCSYLENPME